MKTIINIPMRTIMYLLLVTTIISCQSKTQEDKSEKYIGKWAEPNNGDAYLVIKRVEGKFYIYPNYFYIWDGDNGLTGKVIPAEYDAEKDKLVALYGAGKDIVYYAPNNSLLVSQRELFKIAQ